MIFGVATLGTSGYLTLMQTFLDRFRALLYSTYWEFWAYSRWNGRNGSLKLLWYIIRSWNLSTRRHMANLKKKNWTQTPYWCYLADIFSACRISMNTWSFRNSTGRTKAAGECCRSGSNMNTWKCDNTVNVVVTCLARTISIDDSGLCLEFVLLRSNEQSSFSLVKSCSWCGAALFLSLLQTRGPYCCQK